jgi:hypothetical protein
MQGFKVSRLQSFKDEGRASAGDFALETLKPCLLRCFEQWLTMCKLVVIIEQFREFESFEDLRVRLQVSRERPR